MSMIYTEDASIMIGGVILPGIYKSVEVSADALVEEQEVEGSAVKPKQAMGYEDAKISIDIELWDSTTLTKEDKLRLIQDIFRRPGQDKPEAKEIISSQTDLRGVNKVILKNLTSKISNKKDNISVMLELWEYIPMTIQTVSAGTSYSSTSTSTVTVASAFIASGINTGLSKTLKKNNVDWSKVDRTTHNVKIGDFKEHVKNADAFYNKTAGGGKRR